MPTSDIQVTFTRAEAQVLVVLLGRSLLRQVHPTLYPIEPGFAFSLVRDAGLSTEDAALLLEKVDGESEVHLLSYFSARIGGGHFDSATLAALFEPRL